MIQKILLGMMCASQLLYAGEELNDSIEQAAPSASQGVGFNDLPDEIALKILQDVKKDNNNSIQDLAYVGQASKKAYRLNGDRTLFQPFAAGIPESVDSWKQLLRRMNAMQDKLLDFFQQPDSDDPLRDTEALSKIIQPIIHFMDNFYGLHFFAIPKEAIKIYDYKNPEWNEGRNGPQGVNTLGMQFNYIENFIKKKVFVKNFLLSPENQENYQNTREKIKTFNKYAPYDKKIPDLPKLDLREADQYSEGIGLLMNLLTAIHKLKGGRSVPPSFEDILKKERDSLLSRYSVLPKYDHHLSSKYNLLSQYYNELTSYSSNFSGNHVDAIIQLLQAINQYIDSKMNEYKRQYDLGDVFDF